jgi:hypothetical protein
LFLNELAVRGHPCYPESRWHNALQQADLEYRDCGPLQPLNRSHFPETAGVKEGGARQLYGHAFGLRRDDVDRFLRSGTGMP